MKNIYAALFFATLTAFFFPGASNAQNMDSVINNYFEQYPQQKAYVQFDKSFYRAGETVWFKAYLLQSGLAVTSSKNFYAELLDNNGVVLQRKVYPLVAASAGGHIDLPANLPGSNYRFRAYTTWMLNFDTSFVFQKNIPVIGKKSDAKPAEQKRPVSLTFFPEGGDLVSGLESVVAFKANNDVGVPENIKGKVVNSKGETVATLKADHDGMGSFTLKPLLNEKYSATWTDNTGKEYTTQLPEAKAQGIVLHITSTKDKKEFSIQRTDSVPASFKRLHLIALVNQQTFARATIPLRGTKNSSSFSVAEAPSGVMQMTVFSDDWVPLAERITIIKNDSDIVPLHLSTPVVNLGKRARNVIELSLPDTNLTNLSMSVTDAAIENIPNPDNIISRMLLTGDIRGYVHNPSFYFTNNSDSLSKYLDLVMLTHGWRKYNWNDIVHNIKPKLKYPTDSYIKLQAKVLGITNYNPLRPDEELTVIVQGKDSSKQVLLLPKTGKDVFTSENMMFYDTAQVYFQFNKDRKLSQSSTTIFNNGLYPGSKKIELEPLPARVFAGSDSLALARSNFFANEVLKYGGSFSGGNVLANVTVKTRQKSRAEQLDEKYARGLFSGGDAYNFDVMNDPRGQSSFNALQYIQGQVPGIQINDPSGANPSVSWRGSATSMFLDEMSVDAQTLANIPMTDIAYIKVLRPPFMGAFGGGAGGAIAVYTRKGGDQVVTPGKGLEMNRVAGYSAYKQFYSPDYSKEDPANTDADYRTTLYWNPFIFMDNTKNKAKLEFYNNDTSKALKVVVEGVNELGQLVHIEKTIQ